MELSADSGAAASHAPWTRTLWNEHGHDDNFTDDSFLNQLIVNAAVVPRSYQPVVLDSQVVTQQINIVTVTASISVFIWQGRLRASTLLACNAAAVAFVLALYACLGARCSTKLAKRAARQVTLLIAGTYLLSPLLQTLTRTISSDSIVATTAALLLLHLFLYDYNFVSSVTDKLSGSLSLAAAIFASVLIASRLQTQLQVFSQVLISLEAYLLLPYIQRSLVLVSKTGSFAANMASSALAAVLLIQLTAIAACAFVAVIIFVTLLCPMWLVRIHKYKAKINGPWDVRDIVAGDAGPPS